MNNKKYAVDNVNLLMNIYLHTEAIIVKQNQALRETCSWIIIILSSVIRNELNLFIQSIIIIIIIISCDNNPYYSRIEDVNGAGPNVIRYGVLRRAADRLN